MIAEAIWFEGARENKKKFDTKTQYIVTLISENIRFSEFMLGRRNVTLKNGINLRRHSDIKIIKIFRCKVNDLKEKILKKIIIPTGVRDIWSEISKNKSADIFVHGLNIVCIWTLVTGLFTL